MRLLTLKLKDVAVIKSVLCVSAEMTSEKYQTIQRSVSGLKIPALRVQLEHSVAMGTVLWVTPRSPRALR